jgi:hypothetical protein
MSALSTLNIHDLRPRLAPLTRPSGMHRNRRGAVTSATVHYNGPAMGAFGNPMRELDFIVNVDVKNHQVRIGADNLCYHFAVLSDGQIWQTRDLGLIAWHSADAVGNEHSIAVHLPLGQGQVPTAPQIAALTRLLDALGADYHFARTAVKGHGEWSNFHHTACPGGLVMDVVKHYRAGPAVGRQVRVTAGTLNIRQGPTTAYKIAGQLHLGDVVVVDGTKDEGQGKWWHIASGIGFISGAYVVEI